jgi:hypothetical protein
VINYHIALLNLFPVKRLHIEVGEKEELKIK